MTLAFALQTLGTPATTARPAIKRYGETLA
jgi:hypothetical protein